MGLYDIPAMTDFILETTGQSQLSYIGHSEGTTQIWSAATLNPDYYAEKFNTFIALAPPTFLSHCSSRFLQKLAHRWNILEHVIQRIGLYDIFLPNWYEDQAMETVCEIFGGACKWVLEGLADANPEVDNLEGQAGYILSNLPKGSGYKAVVHYGQNMKSGGFHRFDHGRRGNMKKYGQHTPPEYDLAQIKIKNIAMLHGIYDRLADPEDVQTLYEHVKDKVVHYKQYELGHLSFAAAKNMDWFKTDVVDLLNKYSTNDLTAFT